MRAFWIGLVVLAAVLTGPAAAQTHLGDRGFFRTMAGKSYVDQTAKICSFTKEAADVVRTCREPRPFGCPTCNELTFSTTFRSDGTVENRNYSATYKLYDRGLVYASAGGERWVEYLIVDAAGQLTHVYEENNGRLRAARLALADPANPAAGRAALQAVNAAVAELDAFAVAQVAAIKRDPVTALGRPGAGTRVAEVASAAIAVAPSSAPPAAPVAVRGPRVALVLGNSRYSGALGALANPANDARIVADALRRTGFQVELVLDADQRAMKQAISRLGNRAAAAGKGATALFYYAGHGIQSKGTNYLVPVGVNLTNEADLELDAVPAEAVLAQLETAGSATNIVILDACRNMPLARATRSGTRGLARMDAPGGSFVAYSTAPGQEAVDGTGANSPFATAFAAEVAKPGQPIQIVFQNVRQQVHQATGRKQTPWDSSSLFESFYFTR